MLVKINNNDVMVKEFQGQRVVTAWDIAKVHEREVNDVTKNFNNNRSKFILGEDYFLINRTEISERKISIQEFIPNNVKEIPLFTESGYLMLVKTFTDDLSWKVQRELVKGYFIAKEVIKPLTPAEQLLAQAKVMVDMENRLNILEKNNARLENHLRRTITNEYFTVIGYANFRGINANTYNSSVIGRKASKICKDCGLAIGKVIDSKYGTINTYPLDVLDEIFALIN
ncbi:ORF6N domain-containing protein [Fusobacterium periodonticum]|uniref:Toxin-antitoxin system, toxin component, Bro family n=1 Tax=Fusobacterium periodonticum 1_1_41FAA TaxID=469621 RepID=D6LIL3_9FUSO|nr:ORF6N domain-containing protein [Fusobacterium periodonticum]EFG28239.1 putative toxin-antitoxin system, toxin component, Bro family [Fusobacterium periodonticum 1_1_41FAA]